MISRKKQNYIILIINKEINQSFILFIIISKNIQLPKSNYYWYHFFLKFTEYFY